MILTRTDIENDIEGFKIRIEQAKAKLATLPESAPTWAGQKKLRQQERELLSEIQHVERLIEYAKEALFNES